MSLGRSLRDQCGMATRLIDVSIGGLEDDELAWEPAPGMWRIADQHFGAAAPDAPFTTIGWRLVHMTLVTWSWIDDILVRPETDAPPLPTDAASALTLWHETWTRFVDLVHHYDDDALAAPVPAWGGEVPRSYLVGHVITEDVHHGAEIGCLRHLKRSLAT